MGLSLSSAAVFTTSAKPFRWNVARYILLLAHLRDFDRLAPVRRRTLPFRTLSLSRKRGKGQAIGMLVRSKVREADVLNLQVSCESKGQLSVHRLSAIADALKHRASGGELPHSRHCCTDIRRIRRSPRSHTFLRAPRRVRLLHQGDPGRYFLSVHRHDNLHIWGAIQEHGTQRFRTVVKISPINDADRTVRAGFVGGLPQQKTSKVSTTAHEC